MENEMKRFFIIAAMLFISNLSFARINLESPDVLLKKASQDRTELREVIFQIEKNIPEFTTQEEFEAYFFIFDKLQVFADKLQLDEIYPNMVRDVGRLMAEHGYMWLDIRTSPIDKILYYHKYSRYEVAMRYYSTTEYIVLNTTDPDILKTEARSLEAILNWATKQFPENKELQMNYKNLISDVANKFLKKVDLNEEDANFWIHKLNTQASYFSYIDQLHQDILAVNANKKSLLHVYLKRLVALNDKVTNDTMFTSPTLMGTLSSTSIDLASKFLTYEEIYNSGDFADLLDIMNIRELNTLASKWNNLERLPTPNFVQHYLDITQILLTKMNDSGLVEESKDLSLAVSKSAAPYIVRQLGIEGQYLLKTKTGENVEFNVIVARDNAVFAAIHYPDGEYGIGFIDVHYSFDEKLFVASKNSFNLDDSDNPIVKFKVDENKNMTLESFYFNGSDPVMYGKKVQEFENYESKAQSKLVLKSGNYRGKMKIKGNGEAKDVMVSLVTVNGNILGRLNDSLNTIEFIYGAKNTGGIVKLTTGITASNSWLHLRGYVEGENLHGVLISGMFGKTTESEFTLKLVK
jgi:hypothetical protein